MNKKGFTVVEIMASFLLISTVAILLFELFISLQQMYNKGEIQTRLLINQANFQRRIEEDIKASNVFTIASCGTNCLRFTLDGQTKELKIQNGTLVYDKYALDNVRGSTVGNLTYQSIATTLKDGTKTKIENVKVPISNKIVKGNYGINIIYQPVLS